MRIYNSSTLISNWADNMAWDFAVEFQPVGGTWQKVFADSNEDLADAGFTSATAPAPPRTLRPMAFVQMDERGISEAEYDAFKTFFTSEALGRYNLRIRAALD